MAHPDPDLPRTLPDEEDLLGFCRQCYRMRWLRRLLGYDKSGNPEGLCRTCVRESAAEPADGSA